MFMFMFFGLRLCLYYVMVLKHVMFGYAVFCFAAFCYVLSCYVSYVMLCFLRRCTFCYVLFCSVVLCYAIFCQILCCSCQKSTFLRRACRARTHANEAPQQCRFSCSIPGVVGRIMWWKLALVASALPATLLQGCFSCDEKALADCLGATSLSCVQIQARNDCISRYLCCLVAQWCPFPFFWFKVPLSDWLKTQLFNFWASYKVVYSESFNFYFLWFWARKL